MHRRSESIKPRWFVTVHSRVDVCAESAILSEFSCACVFAGILLEVNSHDRSRRHIEVKRRNTGKGETHYAHRLVLQASWLNVM